MPSQPNDVASSLSNLSLSSQKKPSSTPTSKSKSPVADSWDDEELSSGSDTETEPAGNTVTPPPHQDIPTAPPPTPISPSSPSLLRDKRYNKTPYHDDSVDPWAAALNGSPPRPSSASSRPEGRPEKTDAVAKRLIAGALGVRAPKRTEEQREYERAMREKEQKKREAEREGQRRAKEEAERAKAAVWGN